MGPPYLPSTKVELLIYTCTTLALPKLRLTFGKEAKETKKYDNKGGTLQFSNEFFEFSRGPNNERFLKVWSCKGEVQSIRSVIHITVTSSDVNATLLTCRKIPAYFVVSRFPAVSLVSDDASVRPPNSG